MKNLTPINTDDGYINLNIDLPKKEVKEIKPIDKPVKVKLIKKKKPIKNLILLGFLISFIIFILILAINSTWININLNNGKLQSNSTIINNIDTPDIPVTINDQDTNNYNITVPVYQNFTIVIQIPSNLTINYNYTINSTNLT